MANMRSGFERSVAADLRARKVEFEYETRKVPYVVTHIYSPDFILLKNNIYVELKGIMRPEERGKYLIVRKQHPEIDLRFVFMVENRKMISSPLTHEQWSERNKFKYAIGRIPQEWIDE